MPLFWRRSANGSRKPIRNGSVRATRGSRKRNFGHVPRVPSVGSGTSTPHSLPENPRRLQEKFNQFFQGGKPNYEMLVTGKFGTRNAAKVATNEQQSVIIKLLSDHRNFDNEQVVMFYNIIAEQMSWTQITVETIRRYRRKYALLTSAGRLGDTEFRNRLAMQVKRRRPKFPLYMWSLDGWVCELLFQEYADGATTYHNRLVVEVVLDPCVIIRSATPSDGRRTPH